MIYDDARILLCPPKCGTRSARRVAAAVGLDKMDPEHERHRALSAVPEALLEGRELWSLTRSPEAWYESWWRMVRNGGDWALNRVHFDLDGRAPEFREFMRQVTHGWQAPGVLTAPGVARLIEPPHPKAVLREQALWRCGWWSFVMRWTTGNIDPRVRWVFMDDGVESALRAIGFRVTGSARHGVATLPRPRWDNEMRGWVETFDGPTLARIRSATLEAP